MSTIEEIASKKLELNFKPSKQTFEQGLKIREAYEARLYDEPVFRRMRNTYDVATSKAPPMPDIISMSLAERKAAAKAKLRDGLKTCVSKPPAVFSSAISQTAPGERSIRAVVNGDVVNAQFDNFSTANYATQLSVHVRGHSNDSSLAHKKSVLAKSDLACTRERLPNNVFQLTLTLRTPQNAEEETAQHADIALLREFIAAEFARGSEREALEMQIVSPPGGKPGPKTCIFNFCEYRDPDRDEVMRAIKRFAEAASMGLISEDDVCVAELLRSATFTIGLPRDLAKVFGAAAAAAGDSENVNTSGGSDSMNWMSLVEGMRIAFEATLCDSTSAVSHTLGNSIAERLLGSRSARTVEMVAMLCAVMLARDTSVRVDLAPPELIFAQAVEQLGMQSRALLAKRVKAMSDESEERRKERESVMRSTAPEAAWAFFLGFMTQVGATPGNIVPLLLGGIGGEIFTDLGDERKGAVLERLFAMVHHVERVESLEIVGPQTQITIRADKGGIERPLIAALAPKSFQALIDTWAKPYTIAHSVCKPGMDFIDVVSALGGGSDPSRRMKEILAGSPFRGSRWWPASYVRESETVPKQMEGMVESIYSSSADSILRQALLFFTPTELPRPLGGYPRTHERYDAANRTRNTSAWDFNRSEREINGEWPMRASPSSSSGASAGAAASGASAFTREETAYLRAMFNKHDYSGDGSLDKGELMALFCAEAPQVPATEVYKAVMQVDKDKSGDLKFDPEFLDICALFKQFLFR